MNRHSKHIDVQFHFIHEKVQEGLIEIECSQTNEQIANPSLNIHKFNNLLYIH